MNLFLNFFRRKTNKTTNITQINVPIPGDGIYYFHLQPVDGRFQHERLQVGAVVQVPHDVNRWLGRLPPSGDPSLQEANAANSSRR